jgi:sarcosine oxidase subunit alpha
MWPAKLWKKYEGFIRRAAGLGKSPTENDPDIYDHKYYHCDVLIIGSGPGRISCGKSCCKNRKKNSFVDERPHFGGNLTFAEEELTKINKLKPLEWINKLALNYKITRTLNSK